VRDILEFKGYRIIEAKTAEDAFALAQLHRPDLILMDIQLGKYGWGYGTALAQRDCEYGLNSHRRADGPSHAG